MSDRARRIPRLHLFVDPTIQVALVRRVVCYWMVCLVAVNLLHLCWHMVSMPGQSLSDLLDSLWFDGARACEISLILLPLVAFDLLRLTNRFVGPLMRLRQSMRRLARGEHVEPIEFRGNDFLQELANEFNAMLSRVQPTSGPAGRGQPAETGREWEPAVGGSR